MYKTLFTLTLLPVLAWSQPSIATPPVNPRAGLMPISPLRSNAVGGGVRIKDLGFIEGARANQLTGFGVVLGLNNTGDKDTVYSKQAIANLLQQYGLTVPATSVSSKNAAAVMVTASLPAFAKSGSRIDVNVMSMGDSTSLTGGTLIQTPPRRSRWPSVRRCTGAGKQQRFFTRHRQCRRNQKPSHRRRLDRWSVSGKGSTGHSRS